MEEYIILIINSDSLRFIFFKKNFFIFLFSQFVINSLLIFFVIFKNNKLINRPHNFLPKIYLSKVLIEGLDNDNK